MENLGKILKGEFEQIENDFKEFSKIKFDISEDNDEDYKLRLQNTISNEVEVAGTGTFEGSKKRKLKFCPFDGEGWYFKRTDLKEPNLIKVDYRNSWTTNFGGVNNIVLGCQENQNAFVRLTEHIISLKTALDIDNLLIETDSYDPPLFEMGSIDIIEALKEAGKKQTPKKVKYCKVKEKVIMGFGSRGFLLLEPPEKSSNSLIIDCAINYTDNVMGTQRIKFPVTEKHFTKGAVARTNCPLKHAVLCKTVGKVFPSTRGLGYNSKNILISGKKRYYNKARLLENGKVLEPIWHRAVLDLLAAAALIPDGLLVGKLTSYKAGHTQDVEFIKELYKQNLLTEVL